MNTREFAIEQAVRLVASTNIENKQKAVFDFAEKIIQWIGEDKEQPKWFEEPTMTIPNSN